MSITIERNNLKEAIASLSKVITKNPSVPILSCVRISSAITGLRISATNLNEHLSFNIKGKSEEAVTSMVVSLDELKDYLEYSKSASTYTLTKSYKGDIRISSDIEEYQEKTLMSYQQFDWPDIPDISKTKLGTISKDALKVIQSAIPSAAAKESVRAALKCLLLEEKAVVASNAVELIKLALDASINEKALIPVTKFISSAVFSDRDSSIGIQKFNGFKYLCISNYRWEYSVKLSEETYPNYMNVIPKESAASFTILKGDTERLKSEIPNLKYSSNLKAIHLHLDKEKLTIFSEDISNGKSITLPVAREGSNKAIIKTIKSEFLLRAFSLGFNKFSFNEGNSPIIASGNSDSFMVFMPMKTHEEIVKQIEGTINSKETVTQIIKPKEESKMETTTPKTAKQNYTPTFQGTEVKTDLMEELINKISSVRSKAREIIDISIDVSNQLRNIQKSTKAKEKEFKVASELIDKLKKVSGF